jgi:hypothetical protein
LPASNAIAARLFMATLLIVLEERSMPQHGRAATPVSSFSQRGLCWFYSL